MSAYHIHVAQPTFPHSKVDFALICSQAKEIGLSTNPVRTSERAIFLYSVGSMVTRWKITDNMNDCEFTLIHEESYAGPQIWAFVAGDIRGSSKLKDVVYPDFGTGESPLSAYENYKEKIKEKIASMQSHIQDMEISIFAMDDIIRFTRES
jgi:hypothetical protein